MQVRFPKSCRRQVGFWKVLKSSGTASPSGSSRFRCRSQVGVPEGSDATLCSVQIGFWKAVKRLPDEIQQDPT